MKSLFALAFLLASPCFADAPPEAAVDMSKMGPFAKPVKNEKQDQKELKAWFKAWEAAEKACDVEALANMIDFPVIMMSDSMAGKFSMMQLGRPEWVGMMKPFMTPEAAKEMKMKRSGACFMLSDDLASCEGQMSGSMGPLKGKIRSHGLMTRVDGQWKMKTMVEAGWGDMPAEPATK